MQTGLLLCGGWHYFLFLEKSSLKHLFWGGGEGAGLEDKSDVQMERNGTEAALPMSSPGPSSHQTLCRMLPICRSMLEFCFAIWLVSPYIRRKNVGHQCAKSSGYQKLVSSEFSFYPLLQALMFSSFWRIENLI